MRRKVLAGLALGMLAACKNEPAGSAHAVDPAKVVARVDDTVITVEDLERHIAKQPPFVRARYSSLERRKELLENLVRFEVMAKEAQKRGYDRDPDVLRFVKQQMINQLVQREIDTRFKVEDIPEGDAERYYREHTTEFVREEEVRVSQIVVKDKGAAEKVAAAARALPPGDDKSFRDLVSKHSQDEDSKLRGGDLTFFDRKDTRQPRAVVEAAFALGEVGAVSAPVATERGFHVLKLTQKRPGFTRPFTEVKRQIQARLFNEMRAKKMEEWMAEMRGRLEVEVFEDKLREISIAPTAAQAPAAAPAAAGVSP